MPIPKNKHELTDFSQEKFDTLMTMVDDLPDQEVTKLRQKKRSVKDHLAHVYAWQLMMETWHREGMKGHEIEMPAPGFTWRDGPELNAVIDKEYKKVKLDEIIKKLKISHKKMIKLMEQHSEKELFTKKKYSWTGSSSLAVYLRLSAYSHYDWAIKKMKSYKI